MNAKRVVGGNKEMPGQACGLIRWYGVKRRMTFGELYRLFSWKPIYGCPGRYVLRNGNPPFRAEDYCSAGERSRVFRVEAAQDPVHIVLLEDGGIISFRKADGGFVHTLSDREGFERKLMMLGIEIR